MSAAMETKPLGSNERYQRLLRYAQTLPPVATAVAHPCDEVSLKGAVEAALAAGKAHPEMTRPYYC